MDTETELAVRKNLVYEKCSNSIVDAQHCIVQSLKSLGLMWTMTNRSKGVHWYEFSCRDALRWRKYNEVIK